VIVETHRETVEESVEKILTTLRVLGYLPLDEETTAS